MSAATQSGFGLGEGAAPSPGQMMRMALGGGSAVRTLGLVLGFRIVPEGPLVAQHIIPPA